MIIPDNLVLMAILPLPPSTNDLHTPVVRTRKAESIFEEDKAYAAKVTNPNVTLYEYRLKNLLNYPQKPWRSWQDAALIHEVQGDASICLDLELYLYFKNNASDGDNRGKALQDMLCRYLEINDNRVANDAYHKRVHKNVVPCVVVKLTIAEKPDIWAEQAELDDLLTKLMQGEKDASPTEDAIILYR
jgi:hypothetical protein